MEAPYILISTISPENGKKIDAFDKHSKYIVKVLAPTDFSETLFEYAEYFSDLSQRDRESDLFCYPFHIVWEPGDWKWYKKEAESAVEWKAVNPVFIETGGYYYAQSVVGYKYNRADFYPYTKAYLETANYLKWYMKNETDSGNSDYNERLFLPMCYLYRNCVELSLKTIWFEEIGEDMNMKKVLLLGATGATGKYIMAEFQKRSGAVLTAYVRNPAKMAELDSTGVNVVYGDVTDTEKLKGVMQEQDVVLASLEGDTLSMAKCMADMVFSETGLGENQSLGITN